MPALTNKRHEAFAIALAKGTSASDAYRAVYGTKSKNVNVLSSRLSLLANVGTRVAELQAQTEQAATLSVLAKRLIYAEAASNPKNDLRDRLHATRLDSELAGHIKANDKGAVSVTVNVATYSEEERARHMARKREAVERRLRAGALRTTGNGQANGNGHY